MNTARPWIVWPVVSLLAVSSGCKSLQPYQREIIVTLGMLAIAQIATVYANQHTADVRETARADRQSKPVLDKLKSKPEILTEAHQNKATIYAPVGDGGWVEIDPSDGTAKRDAAGNVQVVTPDPESASRIAEKSEEVVESNVRIEGKPLADKVYFVKVPTN